MCTSRGRDNTVKSHGNADEMNGAFGMDMDLGRLSKM